MKSIFFNNKPGKCNKYKEQPDKGTEKVREKMRKIKTDVSNNIIKNINNHEEQVKFINKLYLGEEFAERKFIIGELKTKINSYKQQDIKKDFHELENLITLDDIIEKLVASKLKCYYCNKNLLLLFDKVRDMDQWTLDRLNNYDEHTKDNTLISCLKCNLQRRRKNSEKFKFTKQLETNQLKINKLM